MHRAIPFGPQPSSSEGIEIIARARLSLRADKDRDVRAASLVEILDAPCSIAIFVDGDDLKLIAHPSFGAFH